jgi:catechol 2,3-dioxygenase-like lactoylglutathione lyase family enzyme
MSTEPIGARLSHLFMHVVDLAEARRFYVDLLGLDVLLEEPGYLRIGTADGWHIGMEEVPDKVGSTGIELVIRVDDVDRAYDILRAAEIEFETGPQDMPWGARHAWLRDPSGYRLSIYSRTRAG